MRKRKPATASTSTTDSPLLLPLPRTQADTAATPAADTATGTQELTSAR